MADVYTQAGEELFIDYITGDGSAPASYYIGWGTGSGGGKASTDLVTPAIESRMAGAETQPLADKAQWVATITCTTAPKTISEVGLFDAPGSGNPPSGGVMPCYGDWAGTALNIGDKIEFTITHEQT